jgi:hypothetical protein
MPHMLVVTAVELGNPVVFVVLMEPDNVTLRHQCAPLVSAAGLASRRSMYVERGGLALKPNFS